MGKNFQGGHKHKSLVNKNVDRHDNMRFVQDTHEKYAIVTKILGGGSFLVTYIHLLNDGEFNDIETKTSIAHIRGNMKGNKKRDNFVAIHSILLIGLRPFETNQIHSDILHVYSPANIKNLHDSFPHFHILQNIQQSSSY